MVVFKSPGGEEVRVDATDSDDNDDTSLPDWEIRNKSQFKDSNVWRDRGYDRAIAIAISGTVNKTFINDNVTFDPDSVTREINENTDANRNVGAPVTATYTGTCTLIHRLGGTDADSFGIDSSTGQIKTRSGVTYDHEARPSYTVTVTAYHSNCGTDEATVTINVNDVNEPPRRAPLEVVAYPVPRTYDQLFVRWTPPNNAGRRPSPATTSSTTPIWIWRHLEGRTAERRRDISHYQWLQGWKRLRCSSPRKECGGQRPLVWSVLCLHQHPGF